MTDETEDIREDLDDIINEESASRGEEPIQGQYIPNDAAGQQQQQSQQQPEPSTGEFIFSMYQGIFAETESTVTEPELMQAAMLQGAAIDEWFPGLDVKRLGKWGATAMAVAVTLSLVVKHRRGEANAGSQGEAKQATRSAGSEEGYRVD